MKRIISCACVALMGGLLFLGAQKDVKGSNATNGNEELSKMWTAMDHDPISVADYDMKDYVTLGEYRGIEVEVPTVKVDKELVIQAINQALTQYPDYEKTDKKVVEKGDVANIDYEGKIDGKKFEGGSAKDYPLTIGSGQFIPGFEEGLVGAKVGETKEVKVTFPKDYDEETLAGKKAVFTVKVNSIGQEVYHTFDDVTDEFVKENLGYDTVDDLFNYVFNYQKDEAEKNKESASKEAMMDVLLKNSKVTVPKELLEYKIREYLSNFVSGVVESGGKVGDYLQQMYQSTPTQFEKKVTAQMKKSIQAQMVLYTVANKEKLEADKEGYDSYVQAFVSHYQYESKKQLFKEFPEKELKLAYRANKATEFILKQAKITYTEQKATKE
ncbi:trigger factor [Lachnospiraceae bacterium XBB1006]|nr:trigger factor [Lachnospiraceae bacterium XBB1006]